MVSFDYDPKSAGCARELRRRFFTDDPDWEILEGSVLDEQFMEERGTFDVVYSWGVLHHTGRMWDAIDMAIRRVGAGGRFGIAIYNDEGLMSQFWLRVKTLYCKGWWSKILVCSVFFPVYAFLGVLKGIFRHGNPLGDFRAYRKRRGMSPVHDWHDWLGGLPFEVATSEEIFEFFRKRGFELRTLISTNRLGCNQLMFERAD